MENHDFDAAQTKRDFADWLLDFIEKRPALAWIGIAVLALLMFALIHNIHSFTK